MPGLSSFLGGLSGGALGTVLVEVGLDTRSLEAGLAKTKAEVAGSSTAMGNAFKLAIGTGVAVAGVALVKFTADAVHAAENHQAALAQLTVTAGANTKAYEALAAAQVKLTGFTEDQTIAAETNLSRFKLTADQMRQLIPLVEDYARATGQDAASAATAIGKALLGNTRALKTIGIQFKATGNQVADVDSIIQLLSQHVGGASAAFAQTYAGRITVFGAEFDKLKIQIGEKLLPILGSLVAALTVLLQHLPAVTKAVVAFGVAWGLVNFDAIAAGLRAVVAALVDVGSAAVVAGTAVKTGLAGIATGVAKATGLVALLAYALGSVNTANTNAASTSKAFSDTLTEVSKSVKAGTFNMATFTTYTNALAQANHANADAVRLAITQGITYDAALKQLTGSTSDAAAGTTVLEDNIRSAASSVRELTAVTGVSARDFATSFQTALASADAKLSDTDKSASAFGVVIQTTMDKARAAFASFRASAATNVSFMGNALQTLSGQASVTADQILTAFKAATKATQSYGKNLLTVARIGGGAGKDLANSLLALGPAGATMASSIAGSSTKVQNSIVNAFNKGKAAADSLAGKLTKAIEGTLQNIEQLLIAIAKHWGITVDLTVTGRGTYKGPSTININAAGIAHRAAAKGFEGMVTKPTWFLTGEAGPERVSIVPRRPSPPTGHGHGDTTTVYNVNVYPQGNVITNRDLTRDILAELRRVKGRNAGELGLS